MGIRALEEWGGGEIGAKNERERNGYCWACSGVGVRSREARQMAYSCWSSLECQATT